MGKFINLAEEKFGRLTAIERVANNKWNKAVWLCRCDCGNETTTLANHLRNGSTKSCGCLQQEAHITHGLTGHKLYWVWDAMKRRCKNEAHRSYKNYGNRGISVCDEWRTDFQAFYDWAMASEYEEGLTIDRINNNGNYEPDNCQFITIAENNRNQRRTRNITHDGKTMCISEWARELNVPKATLWKKLNRGWTIARVMDSR
ncbi:MAG: hypothetical protein DRP01_09035 [Archaeoglobales archaeon]|nr:MAG: hypothetical protein DRP01_09035 [Archaeoglobales archaeon]